MRFSYAESMIDPSMYLPLARAVQAAGYDSMVVPDSVCYPEESDSVYPFSPDGNREFLNGKPFIDPFVLAAAMGAVTEKLRFVTFVLKLPIRHPVLVAKQSNSVAVMCNGRFALGVGTSPWPEDYEICDVPWEGRGRRMDESIEIIQGLGTGEFFGFKGQVYELEPVKISPVPESPVPLLVGGHGDAALKRAARVGDGWLHGGGDLSELPGMLGRLNDFRKQYGRQDLPFEVHVISADSYSVDGIKRLEEQGVTDVIVGFRWPYVVEPDTEVLQTKVDNLNRYADEVIDKVR